MIRIEEPNDYTRFGPLKNFMSRLRENYGLRLVLLLFCNYFFLKGFVASCVDLNSLPFIKNHIKVNETTYQIYILIAYIPWSTKAFIGSVSDLYPLLGFHKKYYMLFSAFIGSSALLLLAALPFGPGTRLLAPLLMFLVMLQISVTDLLCEAKYAKEMKRAAGSGSEAVSFVWICVTAGSLVASAFVGVFTDYFSPRLVYLVCLPFAAQIVYPIYRNFMGETRKEAKLNFEKLGENFNLFCLALTMAVLALGMGAVNLLFGKGVVFAYSIISSVILCAFSLATMEPAKAKCNVYLFLVEATYVQIPGAMDYWYTAGPDCVAGGPAFDMTYYLTYTNIVGAVASVVGITIFQTKMSNWPFRRAFLLSSLIRISSSFFDIIIVSRLNLRLGVPDKFAYLLGDALILNTASMMASMPAILLTASVVSDGLESTTYALLAGFQNFGQNVSKSFGIVMMYLFGINADSRPCDFSRLSSLIFVCHSIFPILPLLVMPLLIGQGGPDSTKIADEEENKTRERKKSAKLPNRSIESDESDESSSSLVSLDGIGDESEGETN